MNELQETCDSAVKQGEGGGGHIRTEIASIALN